MNPPGLTALPFESWTLSLPLLGLCGLLITIYLEAVRKAPGWPLRRTGAFLGGFVAIIVALDSGVDSWDDRLLSDHMIQHLLLIEVGPALLLCGRPFELALRALPPAERRAFGRAMVSVRRFARSVVCLSLYTVIILGTHIPVLFDAAVRHQAPHEFEHCLYLVAGCALWWPLLGEVQPNRRLGTIGRLAYVTIAMLPMTLIGAYLNRDQSIFYPAYAAPARTLGISAVIDQQRAGAIMWVAGTTLMATVGMASVLTAMLAAERRQRARDLHEVVP